MGLKPSLIVPCYHHLLRIALWECVGGEGLILLPVFAKRSAEGFKGSKMKSSGSKPTLKQGLKAR